MGTDAVPERRLPLLSEEKPRQAADIFHQAENKLGGGRNWAIFQSAGTQSIQTEALQPALYVKHPLAIAQHNTTQPISLGIVILLLAPLTHRGSRWLYNWRPIKQQLFL